MLKYQCCVFILNFGVGPILNRDIFLSQEIDNIDWPDLEFSSELSEPHKLLCSIFISRSNIPWTTQLKKESQPWVHSSCRMGLKPIKGVRIATAFRPCEFRGTTGIYRKLYRYQILIYTALICLRSNPLFSSTS